MTPNPEFAFRLSTDVAAQIRATALPAAEAPRRRRLAPVVWRFDDRSAN
jgi:hypothetical protein